MHIEFTVITAFFPTQAAGLGFLLPGRVTDSVVPDRLIWGFSHLWPATRVGTERRRRSQAGQEESNALGVQCLGDLLGLVRAVDVWLRGGGSARGYQLPQRQRAAP